MRRYANQSTKFGRFLARNGGNLWGGLKREVAIKLYLRPWARRLVRPFVKPSEPQTWVFLVGCYNSGTTILREILEAHPEISAMPFEGVRLTSAFPDLERSDWPRMMYRFRDDWVLPEEDAASRVEQAKTDWALWFNREASVYLEKSIDHTTRMDWLARHFGNVRFIAIRRNGYAVCEGVLRRSAPKGEAVLEVGDTYDPTMVAAQWVAFDEEISENLVPERDVQLTYEDFMTNPVPILQEIFGALSLSIPEMSFSDKVLTVGARSYLLENQNEASIARIPQPQLRELSAAMGAQLKQSGYEVLDV